MTTLVESVPYFFKHALLSVVIETNAIVSVRPKLTELVYNKILTHLNIFDFIYC